MKFKKGDLVRHIKTRTEYTVLTDNGTLITVENYGGQYPRDHFELVTTINGAAETRELILPPGAEWVPGANKPEKTCTCGISAIGGGLHSDWCDLSEGK